MIDFFKKHKTETVSIIIFIVLMVFVSIYNFGVPKNEQNNDFVNEQTKDIVQENSNISKPEIDSSVENVPDEKVESKEEVKEEAYQEIKQDATQEIKQEIKHEEKKEEDNVSQKHTCSLTVSCKNILDNMENLKSGKEKLIPNDGIIIAIDKVSFEDGETAFDVLLRELDKNKISIEYQNTQFSAGCYIENIGGIGEFDCGKTSGWLYKVNGELPNVAVSKYVLKNGDNIEFLYSCKMGDV